MWIISNTVPQPKSFIGISRSTFWATMTITYRVRFQWRWPFGSSFSPYLFDCNVLLIGCLNEFILFIVVLLPWGRWKFREIAERNKEEYADYWTWIYCKLEGEMEGLRTRDDWPVSSAIAILDLEGFPLKTVMSLAGRAKNIWCGIWFLDKGTGTPPLFI